MVNKRQTKKTTRKEYSNPQTGDNLSLYLITLFISLIGLISGKIYLESFNKVVSKKSN